MSVSQTIDGNTLIAWGFRPGRWFKDALETANTMRTGGDDDDAIFVALQALQPIETLMRTNGLQFRHGCWTVDDTVIFWVGDQNWHSQGAMTKIGGIKREGLFTRALSGERPYFIFEITKSRYRQGGRALVE